MQYLPIYPEKSWSETVLPSDYRWNWWEDWLPLTDSLITSMASLPNNYPETLYPRAIGWISMPFIMLTDAIWTIWNTAYNWYKRVYNYWANAYNNVADTYNNWQMQRNNPQTSLTWRKITSNMAPAMFQAPEVVATEVPQPEKYLYWNGKIQAKIIEPPVYKYSTGMPTANRQGRRFNTFM